MAEPFVLFVSQELAEVELSRYLFEARAPNNKRKYDWLFNQQFFSILLRRRGQHGLKY